MADSPSSSKGSLLSVAEALEIVTRHAQRLPPQFAPLISALGLVLAEDVPSDLDMPPYDKALMDGYAVRTADLPEGRGLLRVLEEVPAGRTPTQALVAGTATRIMTGAPIPPGADAVIMVERTRTQDGTVQIDDRPPGPGQNILPRAAEMRRGDIVLKAAAVLRPQELGILAAVGRTAVMAIPAPRLAVLSTGDELVEVAEVPGPGQVRNSNATLLLAKAARAGAVPRSLGIGRDSLDSLRPLVADGLRDDILVLSGGVSAGDRDLVPAALAEAGVVAHFHKVSLRPGKPVFFGTCPRRIGPPALVFGLPGNPVSSLVCFELFVCPALRRLAGHDRPAPARTAALAEDFRFKTDRPTYHPARLEQEKRQQVVRPVPWLGSADLRALLAADVLLFIPPGDHHYHAGQSVEVLPLDGGPHA